MRTNVHFSILGWLSLVVGAIACSFVTSIAKPDGSGTDVAGTVSALQTGVATSQAPQVGQTPQVVEVPSATPSITPEATQTPKSPVVGETALCWTGPGSAYPVVSSVKQGTAVVLLGIGSKPGWFVIENPRYRDRCWIEARSLQIDPNQNLLALKVFNPPPTPGPTPGPTATP